MKKIINRLIIVILVLSNIILLYNIYDLKKEVLSYKENYKKRSRVNDMIDLVPGIYSVGISGGISDSKKIYGLQFGIVEELPRLGQAIDSDSFDFNI